MKISLSKIIEFCLFFFPQYELRESLCMIAGFNSTDYLHFTPASAFLSSPVQIQRKLLKEPDWKIVDKRPEQEPEDIILTINIKNNKIVWIWIDTDRTEYLSKDNTKCAKQIFLRIG